MDWYKREPRTVHQQHQRLTWTHFTAEFSRTEITFLDLYKGERFAKEGILEIKTCIKPTNTQQYIHNSSAHPPGTGQGIIKGVLRHIRMNSNEATFQMYKEKHVENMKGQISEIKVFKPLLPTDYCLHQYHSTVEMTSTFETRTRILRYGLRSREIYIKERTPISSPGDTVWTPQDAGWKHKYGTGDTKQPVQAVPIGKALHVPYSEKSANCTPPPTI